MKRMALLAGAACTLATALAAPLGAIELDPKVIAFKLPDQIAWRENPRSGNRSAVLQGTQLPL